MRKYRVIHEVGSGDKPSMAVVGPFDTKEALLAYLEKELQDLPPSLRQIKYLNPDCQEIEHPGNHPDGDFIRHVSLEEITQTGE